MELYVLGYLYGVGNERLVTEEDLWEACNADDVVAYIKRALTVFWDAGYLDFYYSPDSSETQWQVVEDGSRPIFYERDDEVLFQ